MAYILSCCSTVDLSKEHLAGRNIPFACFHYILDDVQYDDDLGVSMPLSAFYRRLAEGATATTSQVNVDEYIRFFTPFLEAGQDIIHVSLSSGISGAFNSANIAREELIRRYPDRRLTVIDSLGASSGYGLFMELLADARDAGASYDALVSLAESLKLRIHHWFFSSDLTAYIRGGRVSKVAGYVGSLLGICPLLNMDNLGRLIPREKIRTKRKVKKVIVEKMLLFAENHADYNGKCFISHSDCLADAQDVAALVENTFPNLNGKVRINDIGTTIGSHTGRDTIALFFVGEERKD